jgi:hypothetical protein
MFLFFVWSIIAAYAAVGGAIVSWNVQLGDEKTCVSAVNISDTLEELPKFVGKTVCPNVLMFAHFHQVSIFEDIACVVINDGANEVNDGVRGWGDCFEEDALSCERISVIKRMWMGAK